MMEVKCKTFCQPSRHAVSHSALFWPLLVTSWLFVAILVTQCPFWLLGILATRCPYGCLALSLTTPGRISCKHSETIDAAREAAIFRHDKPSVCTFSLAVKCRCFVDICHRIQLGLWKLSCKNKTRSVETLLQITWSVHI